MMVMVSELPLCSSPSTHPFINPHYTLPCSPSCSTSQIPAAEAAASSPPATATTTQPPPLTQPLLPITQLAPPQTPATTSPPTTQRAQIPATTNPPTTPPAAPPQTPATTRPPTTPTPPPLQTTIPPPPTTIAVEATATIPGAEAVTHPPPSPTHKRKWSPQQKKAPPLRRAKPACLLLSGANSSLLVHLGIPMLLIRPSLLPACIHCIHSSIHCIQYGTEEISGWWNGMGCCV